MDASPWSSLCYPLQLADVAVKDERHTILKSQWIGHSPVHLYNFFVENMPMLHHASDAIIAKQVG
jgi:hypothetical protein